MSETRTREQPLALLPNDSGTLAEIAAARQELDYHDSQSFVFFGARAQTGLTDVATKMIAGVKNKDIAPASDALSRVVLNIRGFSLDDLKDGQGVGGWLKSHVLRTATPIVAAMQRYETVQSQINVVINDLDRHVGILMRDVVGLDQMYVEALASFRALKIYITAGEAELEELTTRLLPALKAKAAENPMMVQEAARLEALAQRLERRVHDFKLTRQATLQSLPMIMLMQDNDSNLVEKIQSAIINTIPIWKQRIAMLVTARHAEQAARAVGSVTDLTSELLVQTADAMHRSNKIVRTEVERGLFDLAAIKQANDLAVATLDETRTIYEDAVKRRREEAVELERCETAIRAALIKETPVQARG